MTLSRSALLASVIVIGTALLPFVVDRQDVEIERRQGMWTVSVEGRVIGVLEDLGTPWRIQRAVLFLTGGGSQCWEDVRWRANGEEDVRRFTLGREPAPWTGLPRAWVRRLYGACAWRKPETRIARSIPKNGGDFSISATLAAGSEAGIILESSDRKNRARLWMRPRRHHDAELTLTRADGTKQTIAIGPVGAGIHQTAHHAAHLILSMLVPAAAVALCVGVIRRWRGTLAAASLPRPCALGAFALAGALYVTTLYVERGPLQAMPHVQDAVSLIFQARNFALGRLASPSPPEPRFFDHEFVINDGLWFGKYPPGTSLLYAVGLKLSALDLVNPVLGAGSILLLYALGAQLFGRTEGLLAAALAASSPLVCYMGATYLSHSAALFFVLAFLVAVTGPETVRRRALAGFALGAAILVRPQTAVAAASPFALLALVEIARRKNAWRSWLACAAVSLVGVLAFLAYNRALTGSVWVTPFQLYSPHDRLGFGDVGVEWAGNFTPAQAVGNWTANLDLLGPTTSALGDRFVALALLPWLVGSLPRSWCFVGASGVSIVALFFFYFHDGIFIGPRYWYETLPVLFVGAARGLTLVGEAIAGFLPVARVRPVLASAVAIVLGASLAAATARLTLREASGLWGWNDMSRHLLAQTESIPGRALVFVDSKSFWQPYGEVFWTMWPDLERNRIIYARNEGTHNVPSDRAPIPNSQLADRYPERAVYSWSSGTLTKIRGPIGAEK